MRYPEKNNAVNITVLSLLLFGVLYICISTTSIFEGYSPFQKCQSKPLDRETMDVQKDGLDIAPEQASMRNESKSLDMETVDVQKDGLDIALEQASMRNNKTVIIAIITKAYVEGDSPGKTMLDIFLEAFWVGEDTIPLLDHLLLVAVDQTAYDRCIFRRLHCYKLVIDGVDFSTEALYMSENFVKLMWARVNFLGEILRRGYSFLFTDTDIMWLRSPFKRLSADEGVDFQISCDTYNGDPWSLSNHVNAGFFFARPNNKTIALFETWYSNRNISFLRNEQEAFDYMKNKGVFEKLGVRVMFLDNLYFSGFCINSRDFNVVTTVHANCCRSTRAKLTDLIVALQDWNKYKLSTNHTMRFYWSNHSACIDSWLR